MIRPSLFCNGIVAMKSDFIKSVMKFSIWAIFVMSCQSLAYAQIYLVSENGPLGLGDGSTWSDTMSLQGALATATAGEEIWVKEGIYVPGPPADRTSTFQLVDGVELYGGFLGNETNLNQRNWRLRSTILSGDLDGNDLIMPVGNNSYHVVTGSGTYNTTILDGFIIEGGLGDTGGYPTNRGGGMFIHGGTPIIRNCTFRYNRAGNGSSGGGGGLCSSGLMGPTLIGCVFDTNATTAYGGGIWIYFGHNFTATDCTFINNNGWWGGGVASSNANNTSFTNCLFTQNEATILHGGGLYNIATTQTLTNCTFTGNDADDNGGGIDNYASNTAIISCTITDNWGNSSGSGNSGGITSRAGSTVQVRNTIVANNTDVSEPAYNNYYADIGEPSPDLGFNLENGTECGFTFQNANPGLLPLANNGGKTQTRALQAASDAIDNGTSVGTPLTDQRGYARSGNHDIGAFEYDGVSPLVTAIVSGTIQNGSFNAESDIVTGGATIVITLTNDTWLAPDGLDLTTPGDYQSATANTLLGGLTHISGDNDLADVIFALQMDLTGGDNNAVIRTSDSVLTISLPPVPSFFINSDEVIQMIVPASFLTLTMTDLTAMPQLTIVDDTPSIAAAITGTIQNGTWNNESDIVTGGGTLVVTLTNDTWIAADGADGTNPNDFQIATANTIINGLAHVSGINDIADIITALQADTTGGDNDAVIRTNNMVLTITFPPVAAYSITSDEVIEMTVPASALVTSATDVIATPQLTIVNETPVVTAMLTGTIQNGTQNSESDIVSGGGTIVVTLANDTWIATDGTDGTNPNDFQIATANAIINGLAHVSGIDDIADIITALQTDTTGGDNDAVIRTSGTILTITLPPVGAYSITADEVIEMTVPASVLVTSATDVIATPQLTIVNETPVSAILTGTIQNGTWNNESDIVSGGGTIVVTLSNGTWIAADGMNGTNPNDFQIATANTIINGLSHVSGANDLADIITALLTDTTGGDNDTVVRTSNTVLTITLPPVAAYSITADEVIEMTVPASALVTSATDVIATPQLTIVNETPVVSATLTGTIQNGTQNNESDIVSGGGTIIVTLTNDTWIAADGTDGTNPNDFQIATANTIINGLTHVSGTNDLADILAALQAETTGGDNDAVIRTSNTVLMIAFPPVASYLITADEVIEMTVPATALATSATDVTAAPQLTIVNETPPISATLTGTIQDGTQNNESDIVSGGGTIIVTLTNDTWIAADGTDGTNPNDFQIVTANTIINGLAHVSGTNDLADILAALQADTTGGDNDAVIRTSGTALTITLPPVAAYSITADQVIEMTLPATALVTSATNVTATPQLSIVNETPLTLPTVTTQAASGIGTASATGNGNVNADGGAAVTARGFCWNTTANPTLANSFSVNGSGTGAYAGAITGLSSNTFYHFRAYATNSVGTAYGADFTFTTIAIIPPTVSTAGVSSVTTTTANCGGNVTSDGNATVTARGVCWSVTSNPTIANSRTINGSGLGSYTSNMTGLTHGTTYYVRAYATNTAGTSYGANRLFTTVAIPPSVSTSGISSITTTTASGGGTVISDGNAPVMSRGVCWSTSPGPTIADTRTFNGTGTGGFTSGITGLSPGITYYVRAYATNSAGTGYGNTVPFQTIQPSLPSVMTTAVSSVTYTSAGCGGNVVSDGNAPVTVRGVCWNTSPNPTTSDAVTYNGSGMGTYASAFAGLSSNTVYYVRAYATNSVGTAYGSVQVFTTQNYAPTVATLVSDVTANEDAPNEVKDLTNVFTDVDNDDTLIVKSVVGNTNPTLIEATIQGNNLTLDFLDDQNGSAEITVRGTSGGQTVDTSFNITIAPINDQPTLNPISNLTIAEDSGPQTVYLTGIGTGAANETQTLTVTAVSNMGIITDPDEHYFSSESTGSITFSPIPNAYGTAIVTVTVDDGQTENNSFSRAFTITITGDDDPTEVTTYFPSDIGSNSAVVGGTVTDIDSNFVTQKGVCWGSFENPTTEINEGKIEEGEGIGSFFTTITQLTPNTTYYVRAYLVDNRGTIYGDQYSFLTMPPTSPRTAFLMEMGIPYSGSHDGTSTWYALDLVARQGIVITLDAGPGNSGYLSLHLYDAVADLDNPVWNIIAQPDDMQIAGGETGIIDTTVWANGRYYIAVGGAGFVGNYTITAFDAWFNPGAVDTGRTFYSTPSAARLIDDNDHEIGLQPEEYFRFLAEEGETVSVNLSAWISLGSITATLQDKDGNILDSDIVLNRQTGNVKYKVPETGVYFLGVTANNGATGYYDLGVPASLLDDPDSDGDGLSDMAEYYHGTQVGAEDTDGDGFWDPDELASGMNPLYPDIDVSGYSTQETAGNINESTTPISVQIPGTEETWYRLDLNAGDIISVSLTLDSNVGYVRFDFLDANQNPIAETWNIYGGETIEIKHLVPRTGAYYLKIYNRERQGSYVLNMDRSRAGLEHVVLLLQLLANIEVVPDFKIDINGNGKSGIEEIVFILQFLADLR